jgi:hypothetical protein
LVAALSADYDVVFQQASACFGVILDYKATAAVEAASRKVAKINVYVNIRVDGDKELRK